jgi:SAM-dependent methyltransferase
MELCLLNPPLNFGSLLRTPTFSWKSWGIQWGSDEEFARLVALSEAAYRSEWESTIGVDHTSIQMASEAAGLGGANQTLNTLLGQVVSELLPRIPANPIRVLDIGAGTGQTSLAIWTGVAESDHGRFHWTLLDPAARALEEARGNLRTAGFDMSKVELICEEDQRHLVATIERYDLIVSTAALHHHAFLEPVFQRLADALRPGGFVVMADWHNRLSTHPRYLLSLLLEMDWPEKAESIARFREKYSSQLAEKVSSDRPDLRKADEQIRAFWREYTRLKGQSPSQFIILEGHRPVAYYLSLLEAAGLSVPAASPRTAMANPRFAFPDSSLLAVTFASKAGKPPGP